MTSATMCFIFGCETRLNVYGKLNEQKDRERINKTCQKGRFSNVNSFTWNLVAQFNQNIGNILDILFMNTKVNSGLNIHNKIIVHEMHI